MFEPCRYVKKYPKDADLSVRRGRLYLGALLLSIGVVLAVNSIAVPIIKSSLSARYDKPVFTPVLGDSKSKIAPFTFSELSNKSNNELPSQINIPEKFYLSIPKLSIYNAVVKTNDTSLSPDKMLGHYIGTSLPGESGNVFIYGHATYENYFNVDDYKTIFSKLPKLTVGDKFYIRYNSKDYTYIITQKKTLEPKDVSPYALYYPDTPNKSTATLMTCVPPGRKDYRLIIVGSLIE